MNSIKQSVAWWCFDGAEMEHRAFLRAIREIGYQAVELVSPDLWPLVKEAGLPIDSINGDLSIEKGLNRREHHAQLEQQIGAAIAQAEKWNIPNVIVFSGN